MTKKENSSLMVAMPHSLPGEEILEKLKSSREGLSKKEASERLADLGPNRLRNRKKTVS